jgi:hypothetical protein
MWLWVLGACSSMTPPEAGVVEIPISVVIGVETRFDDAEVWTPDPARIGAVRDQCPSIERVRWERGSASFLVLDVTGSGLERVDRVGAVLPGGALADAHHELLVDGTLRFPVGCESCEVMLGVKHSATRWAACRGPGRSILVEDRAVSSHGQ